MSEPWKSQRALAEVQAYLPDALFMESVRRVCADNIRDLDALLPKPKPAPEGKAFCPVAHFEPGKLDTFEKYEACVLCHGTNLVDAL